MSKSLVVLVVKMLQVSVVSRFSLKVMLTHWPILVPMVKAMAPFLRSVATVMVIMPLQKTHRIHPHAKKTDQTGALEHFRV